MIFALHTTVVGGFFFFFFALNFFLPYVPALNESLASASRAELEVPFPAAGSALPGRGRASFLREVAFVL